MPLYPPSCRLSALPSQLHVHVTLHIRSASLAASETPHYPFPTHKQPSPHQIFHLSPRASQKDIKTRYYDLVRIHHPDSPHGQSLTPRERHARFQAITSAYDVLRGKSPEFMPLDPYHEEVMRRKRFYEAHRARQGRYGPHRAEWTASADDRWKDHVFFLVGILTLAIGLAPGLVMLPLHYGKQHRSAASNLSQARSEARELGKERRSEVRRLAQEIKQQSSERKDGPP